MSIGLIHETKLVRAVIVIYGMMLCAELGASCCSSASLGGVGRMLAHERALVEFSCGTRLVLGSFDSKGIFSTRHSSMSPYLSFEPELLIMTRVFYFLEPFIRLPTRIQKSDRRVGSNLADIISGARIPLIKENAFKGAPGLSLIGTVRVPSGDSVEHDPLMEPEDITGTGKWLFSLSALVEKEWQGINFALGYGFSFEPDYFRDVILKPSTIHSPLLAMSFSPHDDKILTLSLAMTFHTQPMVNERSLIDADRRKMTMALAYMVGLHSHIKINAQLGSDVPIDNIGKNFSNEAFFRLGMRFGVF